MINGTFCCLGCGIFSDKESQLQQDCTCNFVTVQLKLTLWSRIKCWFWGLDIMYLLAFAGAVAMNGVFMHHLKYNIYESSIASLGLGFVLGWLNYGVRQNRP